MTNMRYALCLKKMLVRSSIPLGNIWKPAKWSNKNRQYISSCTFVATARHGTWWDTFSITKGGLAIHWRSPTQAVSPQTWEAPCTANIYSADICVVMYCIQALTCSRSEASIEAHVIVDVAIGWKGWTSNFILDCYVLQSAGSDVTTCSQAHRGGRPGRSRAWMKRVKIDFCQTLFSRTQDCYVLPALTSRCALRHTGGPTR